MGSRELFDLGYYNKCYNLNILCIFAYVHFIGFYRFKSPIDVEKFVV